MKLFKRNAQGKPIFWEITNLRNEAVCVRYGLVGKDGRVETYNTGRSVNDEIKSAMAAKRKDGYKELKDLYDNAPENMPYMGDLKVYLDTYLPKDNTDNNGAFIPMLCKTLEDNKPFNGRYYSGQWKINGERCIITAVKTDDLFNEIHLNYRSRKGIDWTDKLSYLDEFLLPKINQVILDMMLEEGVALDGELYLPGYGINEINSFIKNDKIPQHYQLQFWLYDLAIDDMSAIARYTQLKSAFSEYCPKVMNKDIHLNNKDRLILLPSYDIIDFDSAREHRDQFIDFGFEGLVIRDDNASYQFGGKRNNSMLKFKKVEDGKFLIVDIIPEGVKRSNLPKFICRNDINDELFECTINKPQNVQERYLQLKDHYIGRLMLVEYRERSGIKQVPFHAKGIEIYNK